MAGLAGPVDRVEVGIAAEAEQEAMVREALDAPEGPLGWGALRAGAMR